MSTFKYIIITSFKANKLNYRHLIEYITIVLHKGQCSVCTFNFFLLLWYNFKKEKGKPNYDRSNDDYLMNDRYQIQDA